MDKEKDYRDIEDNDMINKSKINRMSTSEYTNFQNEDSNNTYINNI